MKKVNDSFFDDLTGEKTQYVLGFLAADGCLHTNPKKKITFSSKDKSLLIKIQKALDTDYRVGYDGNSCYQIQVYSDQLYDSAVKLGIPEKKSLTLKYPTWANRHFIRGYFDGDGTVYKQYNRPAIRCGFTTGSRDIAIGLEKHLSQLGLNHHYRYDDKKYFRVFIHRKSDVISFYDILYKDATIYLTRKRNVFQKWFLKNPEYRRTS